MTFIINYAYKGVGNKMRTGTLIIDAKDKEAAKKAASEQLSKETDWHRLTSVKDTGQLNLPAV